jgi:hypothetical protein
LEYGRHKDFSPHGTTTDSGPKILQIPVVTHVYENNRWKRRGHLSFGFAYAGNTLSAISTHALGSACTQNFACPKPDMPPPSIESVAKLFRKVGEHCVRDISSHMVGSQVDPTKFFFEAHIFGFCEATNRYTGFMIRPELSCGNFSMEVAELNLAPGYIHMLGTGKQLLIDTIEDLTRNGKTSGPLPAMREMLRRDLRPDVGGSFQCGAANQSGFVLRPILNLSGPQDRHVTFLGFSANDAGDFDGHTIGFHAIAPELD